MNHVSDEIVATHAPCQISYAEPVKDAKTDDKLAKSITKRLVGLLADLQIVYAAAHIRWNDDDDDEVVNPAYDSGHITDDSWQFFKGAVAGHEEVWLPDLIRQALTSIADSLLQQKLSDWGGDYFPVRGTFEMFLPDGDMYLRLDLCTPVDFDTQVDDILDYDMIEARKLHAIFNGSNTTDVSAD